MRLCIFTAAAEQLFGVTSVDLGTRLDLRQPLVPSREVIKVRRSEVCKMD